MLREKGIAARPGEADLLGLHTGVPLNEKSFFASGDIGAHILIFRGPILRAAGWDPKELAEQIHVTLLHELGHHFGWDEDDLTELGYD